VITRVLSRRFMRHTTAAWSPNGYWTLWVGRLCAGSALVLAAPTVSFAQEASQSPLGPLSGFIPFLLIFVVFYFLLIRPQQTKQKKHRAMLEALNLLVSEGNGIWPYGLVELAKGIFISDMESAYHDQ